MARSTDITSLTEHRKNLRDHFRQVRETGRPLFITTNGETNAVVLSPEAYDALADNESAREAMGDDKLRLISHELLQIVRRNVTIDWTVRETVRAKLRVMVRRILRKYGYPPDLQDEATRVVLEQAEVICGELAA